MTEEIAEEPEKTTETTEKAAKEVIEKVTEKVQYHDFVELDYTGKLADGTVFDTTKEDVAKEHHLHVEGARYTPAVICVGEKQLLPGLDNDLEGKEVGRKYTITLEPEEAFGKRDIKKLKIVPSSTFKEHNVEPKPGLQVDVDGELGTITRVSGGRILVNFNHPLSGKKVTYDFTINRKITAQKEQLAVFLQTTLRIPKEQLNIEIHEGKATVELPTALPSQFTDALAKKLVELTKLKEIEFTQKK